MRSDLPSSKRVTLQLMIFPSIIAYKHISFFSLKIKDHEIPIAFVKFILVNNRCVVSRRYFVY